MHCDPVTQFLPCNLRLEFRPSMRVMPKSKVRLGIRQVPKPGSGQPHSITSSAVASSELGILRPSELAVLRLITR